MAYVVKWKRNPTFAKNEGLKLDAQQVFTNKADAEQWANLQKRRGAKVTIRKK